MSGDNHVYAVFHRDVGYDDETYHIAIDDELERQLAAWRAGADGAFEAAWADATTQSDAPPWMGSTFATLDDAEAAAAVEHAGRCEEMMLVDFGFQSFGARYRGPDAPDDLELLRRWCSEHAVEFPAVDPALASVRVACDRIISRSLEGEMWADFLQDGPEGAEIFAADMVADELRRAGRSELVADLYATLVGEFTFVGPTIGTQRPANAPEVERGFFRRLFGR